MVHNVGLTNSGMKSQTYRGGDATKCLISPASLSIIKGWQFPLSKNRVGLHKEWWQSVSTSGFLWEERIAAAAISYEWRQQNSPNRSYSDEQFISNSTMQMVCEVVLWKGFRPGFFFKFLNWVIEQELKKPRRNPFHNTTVSSLALTQCLLDG